MKYPKVLVIANNCFSLTNSNGRTLGNFFEGWPKECLAEFCLGIVDPNINLCENYFCVTDNDALRAFTFRTPNKINNPNATIVEKSNKSNRQKRAWNMLIRHIVWNSGMWKKSGFNKWVDEFNPDIVLFQNGDSAFMSKIALDMAQRKNVPLMIFNTEGYYFFKENYMGWHWSDFVCFPLYHHLYRKQYRKMMKYTTLSVYCNSQLQQDYDKEFGTKDSPVLYTSSSLEFNPKPFNTHLPKFSYLGNLGLNRPLALIEVANALGQINNDLIIDIYGRLPKGKEQIFETCKYTRYHGLISYDEVKNIMNQSDVLLHVEYSEGKYISNLKYAFSTKIADSLSSGHNFLLYAPSHLACSKYIIESKAKMVYRETIKSYSCTSRTTHERKSKKREDRKSKKHQPGESCYAKKYNTL